MEEYQVVNVPLKTYRLIEFLINENKRLGSPADTSTNSGWEMVDSIMDTWIAYFPEEFSLWREKVEIDLSGERDLKTAVKAGGYNPISYPPRLFKLFKTMLPGQKLNDRKFFIKLAKKYPYLKTTNYKL